MRAILLAAALLAAPAWAAAYDPFEDAAPADLDHPRLALTAWGGSYVGVPGTSRASGALYGGEVGWSFDSLDLGAQATWAQVRRDRTERSPILLLRIGQRFETRRGVEASFALGVGAARVGGWESWFQAALGARFTFGPLFLAAELAFEQADLIRLAGGLGVRF